MESNKKGLTPKTTDITDPASPLGGHLQPWSCPRGRAREGNSFFILFFFRFVFARKSRGVPVFFVETMGLGSFC